MGTINPSIPTIGDPNSTEDADVRSALITIRDVINGNLDSNNLAANAVAASEITDASVTDTKLASPNSGIYKILFTANGFLTTDSTANTYLLGTTRGSYSNMWASGDSISAASPATPPALYRIIAADHDIANKTETLSARYIVGVNGTTAAITFTFGLYPVTVGGAADTIVYTAGTVVSGSTGAIASPGAGFFWQTIATSFTLPSDANYMFGVATSGTLTNNSMVSCHGQLMIHST